MNPALWIVVGWIGLALLTLAGWVLAFEIGHWLASRRDRVR
jgi:hypothetical protein